MNIEPTLFQNSLFVIVQNSSFLIKDFASGNLVSERKGRTNFAKWSPYREEYLVTGEENTVKIWDTRRLLTPVYTCGFSSNYNPRKKAKYINSLNVYEEFFMSHSTNTAKKFEENVIAADFSKDGRYIFIQTLREIFKVDLCCAETDPTILAHGLYNKSFPMLKRTDDEIITTMKKDIMIYNSSGDTKQIIRFHQKPVGIAEIKHEGYLYILGREGDLQRFTTSL